VNHRRRLLGGVAAGLLVADLLLPPRVQVSNKVLIAGIRLYRATVSPLLPVLGVRCRFHPSCSRYTEVALAELGTVRGGLAGAWRILRCGPWTPVGTVDPPPGSPPPALRRPDGPQ
jgi:putative membrane protein insertion efficiency factor